MHARPLVAQVDLPYGILTRGSHVILNSRSRCTSIAASASRGSITSSSIRG